MIVVAALSIANLRSVQAVVMAAPIFGRLGPVVMLPNRFWIKLPVVVLVVLGSLWPLYKPQPRHVLNIIKITLKRVTVAIFCLATIGYFDYTYQLPRSVLIVTGGLLLVTLPTWLVLIREQAKTRECALLVGDDPEKIEAVYADLDVPIFGYVAFNPLQETKQPIRADGSYETHESSLDELECLGGLSRLENILIAYSADTVILAFSQPDREEFFGTLDTCAKLGVTTKAHRDLHNSVLTRNEPGYSELVDIELDPWDWQDRILKRAFDILFSGSVLLLISPVLVLTAVVIKLEDAGPIFYAQERTSALGETFSIIKFRSMTPGDEDTNPGEEVDRVTKVGRILRKTHIDELPQLVAILNGQMSVVGPRAAWTDEETQLQHESPEWRKRWFVKPGMTGLAQIHDVTSVQAEEKLQYDIEYIRRQSIWFDMQIVSKQLAMVLEDVVDMIAQKVSK